ncbi:hypothetical protein KQ945_02370 [Bacillus subtilis subsp. subtilis]|nr:hypothetical protein [Bacillus subtilis subsp. subtilis]
MTAGSDVPQVMALLEAQRDRAIALLGERGGSTAARTLKIELDRALARLRWCERHAIEGGTVAVALPWPGDAFGSFAVFELDEEGHPSTGMPLCIAGQPLDLLPGDLLVHRPTAVPEGGDNR